MGVKRVPIFNVSFPSAKSRSVHCKCYCFKAGPLSSSNKLCNYISVFVYLMV
ncbi:hypothetical protein AXF42_Ash007530 [Apostasia shenzhenica]|uniref:Uncharacterized protein n=1 Tax=Apostasia shenzhenica TaxID=1088818 RepID=A0A2I0A5R0_9ASPA|nr:hypothetical protein AXF42_Ash007530 [Apostasia shenzhenica]